MADDLDGQLERKIEKVKKAKITPNNKQTILRFKDECFVDGLSKKRILKYFPILISIASMLKKDFEKATTEDIKAVVGEIEKSDFTDWTKRDYKVGLKKFYRWLYKCCPGESPEVTKWLRVKTIKEGSLRAETVLNEDDIQKMISMANSLRDRALISLLYESGARYHEFIPLKRSSIQFSENGESAKVSIHSEKTLSRTITVVSSVPYLRLWIQHHSHKQRDDFYLWVNTSNNNGDDQPLSYNALTNILKFIAKNAGITKPHNPHAFRHARATVLSKILSEATLSKYMGWILGTGMVRTYAHLNDSDVEEKILEAHNLKKEKTNINKLTKPCPRCQASNEIDADYCMRCWLPLNVAGDNNGLEKIEFVNKVMTKGFEKEDFRVMLKEIVKEVLAEERGFKL